MAAATLEAVKPETADPAERSGARGRPGSPLSGGEALSLQREQTRRLIVIFAAAFFVGMVYLVRVADVADPLHLFLGMAIALLAVLPGFLWLREGGGPFPVFEIAMLTHLPVYAMPLMRGHERVELFLPEIVTRAALIVIVFQAVAIVTFRAWRATPRSGPVWRETIFAGNVLNYLQIGLCVSVAYALVAHFAVNIPLGLLGILRAVFFGIAIVCVFGLCQAWGARELKPGAKVLLIASVGVKFFTSSRGLLLVEGTSLVVLGFFAYFISARRVPWAPALAFFVFIAILHNGKAPMREEYWENERALPTVGEMPAFVAEWLELGLSSEEVDRSEVPLSVAERTSLLHILCLVADRSPYYKDYLYGETYAHIFTQLIPRALWPEKPRGHVSTYRLAVYYGLQTEEGTERTTIGFGILPEAYANFGYFGVIALAVLLGAFLRTITLWAKHSPIFSFPGLFLILLIAWSFRTELTLSIFISSLFQATVAVFSLALSIKILLGRGENAPETPA